MNLPTLLFLIAILLSICSAEKAAPSTLQIGIKKRVNCQRKASNGDKLSMHYTGSLFKDGSKFDSSLDRNQPLEFTLGTGQVIKGWDKGLLGMCIGEKRKLTIPPALGYGDQGAGQKIPGGATLVFEVELLGIKGVKAEVVIDDEGHEEL
jgi:FKBP-type peptidyl-prolyl cis-trans isomerase